MLRRTVKKAIHLFRTANLSVKASSMYRSGYFTVLSHALALCREQKFLPEEAFRLGLFNTNLRPDEFSKYLSRKKLTKIQKALNPESWESLLKNKGLFYRYCMAQGIAVPKLYAVFFKRSAGWSCDGSILACPGNWVEFFDKNFASEFVIKPSRGAFGKGVKVFNRQGGGFVDPFSKTYKALDIYSIMLSDPEHDSFVIQERLKNHPEIIRLTNTKHLQTVRITTFLDRANRCHIIHAHIKLVTGRGITDAFEYGLTGNIQASASLDDGALRPAVTLKLDGSGVKNISAHPKTGICFDQFQLPMWSRACKLVKDIAPKFLPIRTVGWDVALTPTVPVIVEGNIWWDPPNHHRNLDIIINAISN